MDPFVLQWGEITPEGYDENINQALHVFNFYLLDEVARKYSSIFINGRVNWFVKHLPPLCAHLIRVDTSGQAISIEILNQWRDEVLNKLRKEFPSLKIEMEILV